MGIRLCFGLHRQINPPRVEHVSRGAPQREVCPGREPVVDRTCPNLGTFHLGTTQRFSPTSVLANFIPRVYRWRPWHGRSHPSPPSEFPSHGAFRTWQSLNHIRLHTCEFFDQRRDSGWIHTLLEEAENERMHLMFVSNLFHFYFPVPS